MAGPFRMTMFFRDHAYGWSESHWGNAAIGSVGDLKAIGPQLWKARAALLGFDPGDPDPQLVYVRYSDDSIKGDSLIETPIAGGGAIAGKITAGDPAEVPYSVILLRGESTSLYHKMFYLSGVPDSVIVDPPGPIQPPAFSKALTAYFTVLKAFFAWKGKAKGVPGQIKAITGIGGAGDNVISCPAHGFVTGALVLIQGCNPKYPVTGYHAITVLTPDSFSLNGVTAPGYVYINAGTATLQVGGLFPYTNIVVRGETHRNRGRPFPFVRGRRKVKA